MVVQKLKGFSKDALLYGVGDALGRLIALVLLPIFSRIFIPADYAIIDILSVSYAFVLLVSRFGVPSGMQRFYYRFEGEERRTLVSSSILFLELGAVLLAAMLFGLAGPLSTLVPGDGDQVRKAIQILALALPVELLWDVLVLLLRLRRRAVLFSVANIARVVITPVITYWMIVVLDRGVVGVFVAKWVSLAVICTALMWMLRHEFSRRIRFADYSMVVRFALPGHPGLIVRNAIQVLPVYLLAYFVPMNLVGLFGVARRLSSAMLVYVGAFTRAWNPFAFANEGAPEERRIYEVVFKLLFASLVWLTTVLGVFAHDLLSVLTTEKYAQAAVYVPGVAAYLAVDGLLLVYGTILYTRDRVRWSSYLSVGRLLVFLLAGAVLVPRYQVMGLIVALNLSAWAVLVGHDRVARAVFPFRIPFGRLGLLVVLGVALVVGSGHLPLPLILRVAVDLGVLVIFLGVCVLSVLDRSERERVRARLAQGWR